MTGAAIFSTVLLKPIGDIESAGDPVADHFNRAEARYAWTAVSVQNQHLDVYGVLLTPELRRLAEISGRPTYARLPEVMFRSCGQLIDPYGSQGEQIRQTNFAQRDDMTDVLKLRGGYSETWTVFWITAHFLNAAARLENLDEAADPNENALR